MAANLNSERRPLPRLSSLWVGHRLGYLEKLCLKSALSVGHHVTLYSYTPKELGGVPDGIELRDAREVMPEKELVAYSGSGSYALGANFFRYALLEKGLGTWIDMDVCFLKSIDFADEYVFGWQDNTLINSAVLSVPSSSPIVRQLRELPRTNRRPPWFGPKRSLAYIWKRLSSGPIEAKDMPWGTFGPEMVTYLVKKHKVANRAQSPSVFYPVHWRDARKLYGPAETVEGMIGPDTRTIHMWNGALFGLRDSVPPKGSYIAGLCEIHNVDCEAPASSH